ncbi:MAG: DUF2220 family protein [Bacillota bacterium]|nr:DUF2220 family protein [Bacillota bacterium]
MKSYETLLLEKLIDKYEKSKQFTMDADAGEAGEGPVFTRRILLNLRQEFPEYDVEDFEKWAACNQTVKDLAGQGMVGYRWADHERENILSQVWLLPEGVGRAYEKLGRPPKAQVLAELLECIETAEAEVACSGPQTELRLAVEKFLQEEKQYVAERNSSSVYLPKEPELAKAVLTALTELCRLPEDGCLERVFSVRCFGDSKFFEKSIKSKVTRILRDHLPELGQDSEITGEELLQWVGIYRAPEEMSLCGPLRICLSGGEVDLGLFPTGVSINRDAVLNMDVRENKEIQEVFFIENKANYVDFIKKRDRAAALIVFHGGFYSPVKGLLFRKIYQALSSGGSVRFYHWGDLDLGGFQMHRRLRSNIIPELVPYRMDRKAFFEGKSHWLPLEKAYREKLQILLEQEDHRVFWPLIHAMLENNARLEQEAFLLCSLE